MPPKVRVTKEEILERAFARTRELGFEQLSARSLAKELNCSTQPIFHAFESMEALKRALYERTKAYFTSVMLAPAEDEDTPLFLCMGLRYIRLAQEEKHLFRLLCMSDSFQLNSIYQLAEQLPLPMDPKLFSKTWIFTHGIASIAATNTTAFPPEELKALLVEACGDFAHEA